jgi:hypothetical protein
MGIRQKGFALGAVAGAAGVLLLGAIIALVIVYTGAYNIAATEEHASITRWAFDTTFHRSIENRAANVTPPVSFTAAMAE